MVADKSRQTPCCKVAFLQMLKIILKNVFQIGLQFPYRFWDNKIQGADYFGHIPPGPDKRGMFSVFYDMESQVRLLTIRQQGTI